MKKGLKRLLALCVLLVEIVIARIMTPLLNNTTAISISLGHIVAFTIIMISIVVFFFMLFLDYKENCKNKADEQDKLIKELEKHIEEQEKIIAKNNTSETNGDMLFLMSLSQNLYVPLKITLLKQAVNQHNNLMAALLLANLYSSGIEHEGRCVLKHDPEEAARIYESMCKYDAYGVCEWQLGWYYEKAIINAAKTLEEEERLKRAKTYYELSAAKGYAKAFNSLGNFTHYGWGGMSKNFPNAIGYYKQAANMGDIYGVMNCGLTCLTQYYKDNSQTDLLNQAQAYFETAAQYGDIEGILQLGMIYEIKSTNDSCCLNIAKQHYLEALKNVDNQYSATAYFKLGKMINRHDALQSDEEIITALGESRYKDKALECFTRAYEMYQKLDSPVESGERLFGQYRECFNELIAIFKRI